MPNTFRSRVLYRLYIKEPVRDTGEEVMMPPSREAQGWLCDPGFLLPSPGPHCLLSSEAVRELESLHGEGGFPPLCGSYVRQEGGQGGEGLGGAWPLVFGFQHLCAPAALPAST